MGFECLVALISLLVIGFGDPGIVKRTPATINPIPKDVAERLRAGGWTASRTSSTNRRRLLRQVLRLAAPERGTLHDLSPVLPRPRPPLRLLRAVHREEEHHVLLRWPGGWAAIADCFSRPSRRRSVPYCRGGAFFAPSPRRPNYQTRMPPRAIAATSLNRRRGTSLIFRLVILRPARRSPRRATSAARGSARSLPIEPRTRPAAGRRTPSRRPRPT